MRRVFETPLWKAIDVQKPRQSGSRMYAGARPSRLMVGFGSSSSSANSELSSGLLALRNRSRQLVRDSAYAKRAKAVVVSNVIGTGIGLQAEIRGTRDTLRENINGAIEAAWREWSRADFCHTGGQLHFRDLERQAMGQVFECGEIFIRLHLSPFGGSGIPLALELIEPERLADDMPEPGPIGAHSKVIQGVEVDEFYRPLAYWIRRLHPGERHMTATDTDRVERVPADLIIHMRIIDRWPQVRGEPWMHAVIRKLSDIDGYTEAEIVAARAASMYFGTIETTDDTAALGEEQEDGTYQLPLEPGMVEKLSPGEKLNFVNPNRPNSALDPFLRYMLREMAAGVGTSYESLSRDYSQSNYSSSRLALLEDRDTWRALQQWFIRSFRERLHRLWLRQAVLSRAIPGIGLAEYAADPVKFAAVSFKPRGWSWVDPTKEVNAYKEAVMAGFTTVADVVAQTAGGQDLEEVLRQRRRELDEMEALDLEFDTHPDAYMPTESAKPAEAVPVATASEASDSQDEPAAPTRVVARLPPQVVIHNHVAPADVRIPLSIGNPVTVTPPNVVVGPTTVNISREVVTATVPPPTDGMDPSLEDATHSLARLPAQTTDRSDSERDQQLGTDDSQTTRPSVADAAGHGETRSLSEMPHLSAGNQ